MPTTYREKLSADLNMIPETMLPKIYRVFHMLVHEMVPQKVEQTTSATSNKSLYGIWSESKIDESLFIAAKHSLFSYEKNGDVS